jgi:hypothetical protein
MGDSMHFHSYNLDSKGKDHRIQLNRRLSTDAEGISVALGLRAAAKVELGALLTDIGKKLSKRTLWSPV